MFYKHPEPLRGFDYVGLHYYSLTWSCEDRKPFFTQADRVDLVLQQFLRAAREAEVEIVAYCFMPDHVHQLVKGCSLKADGRLYMKHAKQYAGYYFKLRYGEKPLQRYGHDRWLRKDEEPRTVVRYIIENPVRAGLVEKVEDYPFTGSETLTIEQLKEWAYTY